MPFPNSTKNPALPEVSDLITQDMKTVTKAFDWLIITLGMVNVIIKHQTECTRYYGTNLTIKHKTECARY